MGVHARLSPSGAHQWKECVVSPALEYGIPDRGSKNATEGTALHECASTALNEDKPASHYLGRKFEKVEMTETLLDYVQVYLDDVQRLRDQYTVYEEKIEHWLPASPVYGFPAPQPGEPEEGSGTADHLLMAPREGNNPDNPGRMHVTDAKFGFVKVYASENEQGLMYLANAMHHVDAFDECEEFTFRIVQPKIDWTDEATYTREEVYIFAKEAGNQGNLALALLAQRLETGGVHPDVVLEHARPSEGACRWCRAKASCPALGKEVLDAVSGTVDDFEDLDAETISDMPALTITLNGKMNKVGMIEDWCKAVRADVERRLFDGEQFESWKLVEGRRGARAWLDEKIAEATARELRLKRDMMYNLKMMTPTQLEHAIAKAAPRKWQKMNALITQSEGKASVAPMSDKRPVYVAVQENDFESLDCDDLFE